MSATRTFVENLPGSPAAEYLEARGIDQASAERHRLGFVPEGLPGFEQYAGRLSIPNICASGWVVGIKFRLLRDAGEHEVKYLGLSLPKRIYNLQALNTPSPLIAITEGELDAVVVNQLGIPAIGIPGTGMWAPHYERVLEDYEQVVLVRDPDARGEQLVKSLMKTDLPLRVVTPSHGDVNETVLAGHGEALIAAIKGETA